MREHKAEIIRLCLTAALLGVLSAVKALTKMPPWLAALLFAVPLLAVGFEIFKEAAVHLCHGKVLDEEFLMTVAAGGAFAIGEYAEAVFVLLLFSVGELFEEIASARSHRSIEALAALRPDTANLETADGVRTVPPETVAVGDILVIKPGENVPLDGVVLSGKSTLDRSALTGESLPEPCGVGDAVFSGSVNLSGVLRVRVRNVFAESTASKILALIESAEEKKSRPERFISKFSAVYTPVVVGLAVLLAAGLPFCGLGVVESLRRALQFLVISCPCALVISVPLSYFCGMGGAAKKGILVKGATVLETLAGTETVAFDKTGTLTEGRFCVTAVHPTAVDAQRLLYLACAAEHFCDHPISVSLQAAYRGQIDEKSVENVREQAGFGLTATVDGEAVAVGNARLMEQLHLAVPDCPHPGTVVHLAVAGEYAGHIAVSDEPKPEAAAAISALHKMKCKTVMLTGDRADVAASVAKTLGIGDYKAELLPADKVACLEEILPSGTTVFVGDGINDAPVLARADVGAAMGALGSAAAMQAADVVLCDDRLEKVPLCIRIAQKTVRIVRQNIAVSLGIKFAILVLAAWGISNFWLASFADVGVLILAVANATRAFRISQ